MWDIRNRLIVIWIACAADLLFGDPVWLYHPVRAMGQMITILEKWSRKHFEAKKAGFVLAGCMVLFWFLLPFFVFFFCYRLHTVLGIAVESFCCYQMLALKDLYVESHRVYEALKIKDIALARHNVSMIVGRDTDRLDESGIIRAAVETVAENTSDGVIAPFVYMALFGGAGAMCYKAVNTMDSMVGYKNERYIRFGFAAAKLDDIVNFIPARISAAFMLLAAAVLRYDVKNAAKIFLRDRYQHKSPNSAQTEAVCAGALGLRLAGDAWYFGKLYQKPYIGDEKRQIEAEDIVRSEKLMSVTAFLALLVVVLIYGGMIGVGA
jgi:adenosylcobinamide-phosphate synthase